MILRPPILPFITLALLTMGHATADTPSLLTLRQCTALISQQTAAFSADDWPAVEKISERFVSVCKNIETDSDLADGYLFISIAQGQQNRHSDSVTSASICIDVDYRKSDCHVQKARSLLALDRTLEARSTLDRALKLIAYQIDVTRRELNEDLTADQRVAAEHNLQSFESRLRAAETFSLVIDSKM